MLKIRPITLKKANAYVAELHRHNKPTNGGKFAIACYDGEELHGVAIAGQPVARLLDDGLTLEVTRVCTDGTRNACSILYGACGRIAKEMGYRRVITYTLPEESGSSLKAVGWKLVNDNAGSTRGWNHPSRPREVVVQSLFGDDVKYPIGYKNRWEIVFYAEDNS